MTRATSMQRNLGRMAMIGALALLLGGLMAAPAAAATRAQAVTQANASIQACFDSGGTPDANVTDQGSINTYCDYGNGTGWQCGWWATGDNPWVAGCDQYKPTGGDDTHLPPASGGILDDGGRDDAGASVSSPDNHQLATTPTSPHDHAKKGTKHGHGHHGKRH